MSAARTLRLTAALLPPLLLLLWALPAQGQIKSLRLDQARPSEPRPEVQAPPPAGPIRFAQVSNRSGTELGIEVGTGGAATVWSTLMIRNGGTADIPLGSYVRIKTTRKDGREVLKTYELLQLGTYELFWNAAEQAWELGVRK